MDTLWKWSRHGSRTNGSPNAALEWTRSAHHSVRALAFMHTPSPAILVTLFVMVAACEPERIPATVQWQGHALREVRTLTGLPTVIQAGLGVGRPGLDGVADRGRPFNVTDLVDGNLPMRRFLAAGRDGETWLVALEQGGRGYSVVVFLFSALEATPKRKWDLLERPRTLREVVQQVSQKERHER